MLCGRTTTVEHRASGPVIAGAAASVAGFFRRERWARNAVLRRPGISSMHIERAPAMRSDGLLDRIGNIIRGRTTAASDVDSERRHGGQVSSGGKPRDFDNFV